MKERPLGPSGISASIVAFGAWAIGGWMWGGTSRRESVDAVRAAIDAGVSMIDTAPIYGFGLSESIVGEAIRDRRDKVVLATKCGMVCNTLKGDHKFKSDVSGPVDHGHIDVQVYLHPDSIRREVEGSLRRLQTDVIDLYQTHWQDSTTPIEETMGTLLELKEEGKIRAIGVCNASSEQMEAYRKRGQLDSDQEKFSMVDPGIREDQLPYCREHGLAVLAYSPLARGLLTGKMGPDREFEAGDQRATNDRFSKENRRRVQSMLDEIKPIAQDHKATLAQLVTAWTFHQPGLTHVLVGGRTPEQARENAAAGDIELSAAELEKIAEVVGNYEAAVA
jgi:aryl-alcohol dehydrogenase-like predicted oxidoreductase